MEWPVVYSILLGSAISLFSRLLFFWLEHLRIMKDRLSTTKTTQEALAFYTIMRALDITNNSFSFKDAVDECFVEGVR